MEYKAYHGTDEGYIAPGYYDDDNMFHATMTVEEWKKKNHMPLGDETKQKQQSSNESKEIENKNSSSVVNTNEVEKVIFQMNLKILRIMIKAKDQLSELKLSKKLIVIKVLITLTLVPGYILVV